MSSNTELDLLIGGAMWTTAGGLLFLLACTTTAIINFVRKDTLLADIICIPTIVILGPAAWLMVVYIVIANGPEAEQ